MIIEFGNGDSISVFPCVEVRYDVEASATWFNDPNQEDEYDFAMNYDGCDVMSLVDDMANRGCTNISIYAEHEGLGLFFWYNNGELEIDNVDYNNVLKKIAQDLIAGLDKDFDYTYKALKKLKEDSGMSLQELEDRCWADSASIFDAIE